MVKWFMGRGKSIVQFEQFELQEGERERERFLPLYLTSYVSL